MITAKTLNELAPYSEKCKKYFSNQTVRVVEYGDFLEFDDSNVSGVSRTNSRSIYITSVQDLINRFPFRNFYESAKRNETDQVKEIKKVFKTLLSSPEEQTKAKNNAQKAQYERLQQQRERQYEKTKKEIAEREWEKEADSVENLVFEVFNDQRELPKNELISRIQNKLPNKDATGIFYKWKDRGFITHTDTGYDSAREVGKGIEHANERKRIEYIKTNEVHEISYKLLDRDNITRSQQNIRRSDKCATNYETWLKENNITLKDRRVFIVEPYQPTPEEKKAQKVEELKEIRRAQEVRFRRDVNSFLFKTFTEPLSLDINWFITTKEFYTHFDDSVLDYLVNHKYVQWVNNETLQLTDNGRDKLEHYIYNIQIDDNSI